MKTRPFRAASSILGAENPFLQELDGEGPAVAAKQLLLPCVLRN